MYPPVIKCLLILCLTFFSAGAAARATERPNGPETPASDQTQFVSIIVNERTLTGPNSSAHRRDGRTLLPIAAVARALGDTVLVNPAARLVTVRRQDGAAAELDARLGQVRENGALVLSVSSSAELIFSPNPDELLLPAEIAATLLDASVRYDDARNAVLVARGLNTAALSSDRISRSPVELYQLDYQYDLNRYTGAASQNFVLTATGRIGDGRFTLSSNSTLSSGSSFSLRNSTFNLERPNGQRYALGDLGTGAGVQFLSTNLRGGAAVIPWGKMLVTAFGGKTYSGVVLPVTDPFPLPGQPQQIVLNNNRFRYDTTVFGGLVSSGPMAGGRQRQLNFSAGAMHFGSRDRGGDLAAGSINYNNSRFNLQGDIGFGNFSELKPGSSRSSGLGMAIDIAGTLRVTDELAVQGRYTRIGANFLAPQAGFREPVTLKAAGVTWSPYKWFSASVNASAARDPRGDKQNNKYITAAFTIAPGARMPRIYLSHTESSSSLVRSSAFTMLTASKEFSRLRLFLSATRTKVIGPAALYAQLGANFALNDSNSIEFSQGAGSRGMLSGQFDWRTANLFGGRLSFSAGAGYNYDKTSKFNTYERFSASFVLPRETSLQLNYIQTNSGPTLLLSLRGSLLRKRGARAFMDSSAKEMNSFGRVSGRVYQDVDLNGRYDAGTDKPQAGVQVRVDGNRYVVSDDNGVYQFDAVPSGDHKIYLDLLSVRADMTVLDGDSKNTDLAAGHASILDFRLVRTGRISGRAWLDANENGKFDEGESPLADVRVVTASGRDTLTDSEGYFTIADLPPGEHVVLLDEKTIPEKTVAGFKPLAVSVAPGKETGDVSLPVIKIPAEVKRFGTKTP